MGTTIIPQLQQAIAGLTYTSETTAPFEVMQWEGRNLEDLKSLIPNQANQPIETLSLDRFFRSHTKRQDWHSDTERDRAQRFQALVALLNQQLQDIRVFKVGDTEKTVYIMGIWSPDPASQATAQNPTAPDRFAPSPPGDIAVGLTTTVVET